nr:hypothetical protein CFP56_06744 [Quercus suber]
MYCDDFNLKKRLMGEDVSKILALLKDDPDPSYDERVPSANSLYTEEEEDLDVDRSESDSNDQEDDSTYDPQGTRETAHEDQGKSVEDEVRLIEGNRIAEDKDRENPTDQQ